jgi:ABC-type amino acid transport substrate-binding protein
MRIKYNTHTRKPEGYLYDMWNFIANKLNYNVKEKIVFGKGIEPKTGRTYDEAIKLFEKSNYDVLIGNFAITNDRLKNFNFSRALALIRPVITYKQNLNESYIKQSGKLNQIKGELITFFNNYILPLIILLFISVILGYLLHLSDPKKRTINWAIWGTMGSFLAEPGTIVEMTNPKNFLSVFISFIILAVAFYFAMYLQAKAVASEIESGNVKDQFFHGLKGKTVVTTKGSFQEEIIKDKGGIPKYIDSKNYDDKINKWLGRRDLMGLMTYEETYKNNKLKSKGINKSNFNFGHVELGFLINKKRTDILNEINNIIIFANDKKITNAMCTKYFQGNEEMCKF